MKKIGRLVPLQSDKRGMVALAEEKQLVPRDAAEAKKRTEQSAMLRNMQAKFKEIEKQLKRDPKHNISDKDIELMRSYVVASKEER